MALKIVQKISAVSPPSNGISTSLPIDLKTGYIRLTSSNASNYIEIIDGNNNVAVNTDTSFLIPQNTSEIIKERVAKQPIYSITKGTSTVINFGENFGNPFIVGDTVSISGAQPSGINTSYNQITSKTDSSITINFDSSSIVGVITATNAVVTRSVKIAAYSGGTGGRVHIAEVQVAGQ